MKRALRSLCLVAVFGGQLSGDIPPRIFFTRTLPPIHELGGEDILVTYAVGDPGVSGRFLDTLHERVNRSGFIRLDFAGRAHVQLRARPEQVALRRIQRASRHDVYIGLSRLDCSTVDRSGEGSYRDSVGNRLKRIHEWSDAICRAEIEILDRSSGLPLRAFQVRGEGTSPRVAHVTQAERAIAVRQAAHFAGVEAAATITPRRIRETIELDASLPDLHQVMAMIDAGRLTAARRLLEARLKSGSQTGAVHFAIGAICEAGGDIVAARTNYESAMRVAPAEKRYRQEYRLFQQRNRENPTTAQSTKSRR